MKNTNTQSDELIDIASLARTLWFGRRWIGLSMLVCVALAAVYVFVMATQIYRATSVVMLESREASVAGLDSVLGGLSAEETVVNTEAEVLRGRGLMGRVVDELNLIENPEFNPTLRPPSLSDSLLARFSGGVEAPPPASEAQSRGMRDMTISALLGHIEIRALPKSLVFQITATSQDEQMAAALADTVARQYIKDQLNVRFEATETAATWLTEQLAELQVGLEAAENEVLDFQTRTDLIDSDTLSAMDRQLKETRARRDQLTARIAEAERRLTRISEAETPLDTALATGNNSLVTLARNGLSDDQDRATFEQRIAQVTREQGQNIARMSEQANSLEAALVSMEGEIERQSQDLIRLQQLMREAESSRLLYEHFQTRLKETTAQMGIQQADSRLLSEAVVPRAPAAPRKKLIIVMAGVLGLGFGALGVLLSELQSQRLRSSSDLEALTGLPTFAQIPQFPARNHREILQFLKKEPTSMQAEALRNLRTSIQLSRLDAEPKVIMLSSALPNEGKTALTLTLAQSFSAMGRKVLILDGDIRRHATSDVLSKSQKSGPGLIALLRGDVEVAQARRTIDGLGDVLPVEDTTIAASDLFSSERFGVLMADLRSEYDFILLDTPPVLVLPEARLIGQHADATILVVRWNQTYRKHVTDAVQQLSAVNVKVSGVVLNRISQSGLRHYHYASSYDAYYGRNGLGTAPNSG